jgi:S1-C subfamily serine protease
MKKILLLAIAILAIIVCVQLCSNPDTESSESEIDNIEDRVEDVEGNTLILESGLRVRLVGVQSTDYVAGYLRGHVVGKTVLLVADRQIKTTYNDYDKEIPAYVLLANQEEQLSINHQLIIENARVFNPEELGDSLDVFRPQDATPERIPDLALYMKTRSFLITVPDGLASGFFINENGLALTNNHVLSNDAANIYLYNDAAHDDNDVSEDRKREVARLIYTDEKLDISIFRVRLLEGEKVSYFRLAKTHVPQGTRVATYGNPGGLTASFTTGDLSAYRDNDIRPLVQYSMATNPGNSGGPVADEYGRVIAIHDLGDNRQQNINYGIDILVVREILDSLQLKYYSL